jgi:apolipoprotein N-acyltransferase
MFLLSLLSGLLLAASWPEHGLAPLIFVAFVPLLFIQQYLGDTRKKGMFWYAWLSFLIWNALTTWWIWYSTDVGSILAIALNSLFVAVIFYLFHQSKIRFSQNRTGFFILLFYWISWEYFHMNWDLTWSWLNLGNVFASTPKWIQWYEYTGTLGGTAWVITTNIIVYHILQAGFRRQTGRRVMSNGILLTLLLFVPIIISFIIYDSYHEEANPVEVVVVQPNSDPYNEQYDKDPMILLHKNLALADQKVTETTDFLVFPESTLYGGPNPIWEGHIEWSPLIRELRNYLHSHPHLSIVIGASTYREIQKGEKLRHAARKFSNSENYYYAYNTALLIDTTPKIQIYHKAKLTPGVENMPSWGILRPLEKLAINLGGTVGSLGTDNKIFVFTDEKGQKVAPIICYESVYGEFVGRAISKGAELIFVITNDGWWGNTPGHRQHFLFSVLRAIETRRSVARSANTGISAFINQRGDVFQKTQYWEPAVISQQINMNDKLTYYVKNGDYIARVSVFVSVSLLLISFVNGFLKKNKSLV